MIFGTFDFLHEGHKSLITQAKALGDVTIVVARSLNVEKIKGRMPAESEEKRTSAIREFCPSCTVVLGDSNDFLAPLRAHTPDLLLLGYDQKLPPGVAETDLPCPIRRAEALRPDIYKSSLIARNRSPGDIDQKR